VRSGRAAGWRSRGSRCRSVLAWPPFAEGLITGNSQILAFAAFVAFLYEPIGGGLRPKELRPACDAVNGVLAAAVGAVKATQLLPILYLARRRFRAAAIGVMALGAVAAAMLPWTGISIYGDWLAQLERAADPSWTIGGVAVGRLLHIPDLALAAAGIAIALAARGRDAGVWLGIALLIATPSVHGYTFLFLLPGLLTISPRLRDRTVDALPGRVSRRCVVGRFRDCRLPARGLGSLDLAAAPG